jgi:hypothetical protein
VVQAIKDWRLPVKDGELRWMVGSRFGEVGGEGDPTGWLSGEQPDSTSMGVVMKRHAGIRGGVMGGRREMKMFAMR